MLEIFRYRNRIALREHFNDAKGGLASPSLNPRPNPSPSPRILCEHCPALSLTRPPSSPVTPGGPLGPAVPAFPGNPSCPWGPGYPLSPSSPWIPLSPWGPYRNTAASDTHGHRNEIKVQLEDGWPAAKWYFGYLAPRSLTVYTHNKKLTEEGQWSEMR